jgi:MFS family permease
MMADIDRRARRGRLAGLRFTGRLWHHPDFLKLWASQSVSRLGTVVTTLALPTIAIQQLEAGPVEIGFLAALQALPFPILGIPSGVVVDRLPRRPIMVVSDLGRLLALASIPLAYLGPGLSMAHLYIVALMVGVFTPFSAVASQAYLKGLLDRADLAEGNAKLEISNSTANVAGRALAGALIFWIQAPLAILVDAASYLVSALLVLAIRRPELISAAPGQQGRRSFWRDAWDGLVATFGDGTIRLIAASSATVNLGISIVNTVYLLYAYDVLGLNAAEVGVILAVGGAGSIVGAMAVYPVSSRVGEGPAMASAVLVGFASYLLLPLAQLGPIAAAGLVVPLLSLASLVLSVCLPIYFVNTITVRQATVPDQLQGRVVGTIRTVVIACTPVGALVGGALGQFLGLVPTLLIGAAVGSLALVWIVAGPIRLTSARRSEVASARA